MDYIRMTIGVFGNLHIYSLTTFPGQSLLLPWIVRCGLSVSCSNCYVGYLLLCSPAPTTIDSLLWNHSPNKLFLPCVAVVVEFYHRNRKVTTSLYREWGIYVKNLTNWRSVRLWELWTRKAVECYKQNVTDISSSSLEGINEESNAEWGNPAQEVSEDASISNRARGHSCDIFSKNLAASRPGPKKVPGQISLAQDISRICGVVVTDNS